MQAVLSIPPSQGTGITAADAATAPGIAPHAFAHYQIIRRNGTTAPLRRMIW